jgi:hypothetical protein
MDSNQEMSRVLEHMESTLNNTT